MKRKFTIVIACLFFLTAVFYSCKKDSAIESEKRATAENPVLTYIKSLGFKDSDIREVGDKYVVDGDIVFYKNRVYKLAEKPSAERKKINQYGTGSYVNKTNIIIRVDASMSGYINEINNALNLWNNAGGVLRFSIYNGSGPYDITMYNVYSDRLYCGYADFPSNGNPGSFINIDPTEIQIQVNRSGGSFTQELQSTIGHEIGHTIGIMHTNFIGNQHLPGTPTGGDAASIMNGGVCGVTPPTLSANDIWAYQHLYPVPYKISGPYSICSSANYSIQSLPVGATVTWSVNGPLSIQGSNNSYPLNVSKTGDGDATITATITTTAGFTYTLSVNAFVGVTNYVPYGQYMVAGETNAITNASPYYTYSVPAFPGAISYTWHVTGGAVPATIYNNNSSNPFCDVKFNSPGYHGVVVQVTTECGDVWLDNQQLEVLVTNGL